MLLINRFLDVVAPHKCVQCGREGSLLCGTCQLDACPVVPSRCYRCKKLTTDFAVCTNCKRNSALKHVWVRTEYNDVAKHLVYKLKFHSARSAAGLISGLMAEALPVLPTNVQLVHIPTATRRYRQRGFDHARLLANELGHETGLPVVNLLARIGQTRQVGSRKQERLQQLERAFMVKSTVPREAHVLLVDDIVTTGGTLEAAARVLKQAGVRQVDAIVFAQK